MKTTFPYYFRGTVFLSVCMVWSACALIPKPDTCECSSCKLDYSDATYGQSVEICACRPWNRSGIRVEEGQEYLFAIVEQSEKWIDGDAKATPENGWEDGLYNFVGRLASFKKRSDKTNWYALVGAIDQSDQHSFAVFPRSVVIPKSGELYFYANDMEGRYFNNRGIIHLKVIRVR